MIAKGAQQQRNGVLASLGLVADSLRMLPTQSPGKDAVGARPNGPKSGKGWIFITSQPDRARRAPPAS